MLSWSGDVGITQVVRDVVPYAAVIAFGLGAVISLVFERRDAETEVITEGGRETDQAATGTPLSDAATTVIPPPPENPSSGLVATAPDDHPETTRE